VTGSLDMLQYTLLVGSGSFAAGLIGALTGLGGGVVIVPLLTLLFHVNLRYAVGASLISVIATSSGAAAAYVREGYTNIRIGMSLEVLTTLGAVSGAFLARYLHTGVIAIVFGVMLVYSSIATLRGTDQKPANGGKGRIAQLLGLNGSYPSRGGKVSYGVRNFTMGSAVMYVAGVLSGLLGIGSGAAKVLAMDRIMKVPFKVSTTTSNFMIGVTAAASAGIYFRRGYIDPDITFPVVLGVLAGSLLGTRILVRAQTRMIRVIFSVVILFVAGEMILHGVTGRI
jgi:uncharacterized membrane protein YfcA